MKGDRAPAEAALAYIPFESSQAMFRHLEKRIAQAEAMLAAKRHRQPLKAGKVDVARPRGDRAHPRQVEGGVEEVKVLEAGLHWRPKTGVRYESQLHVSDGGRHHLAQVPDGAQIQVEILGFYGGGFPLVASAGALDAPRKEGEPSRSTGVAVVPARRNERDHKVVRRKDLRRGEARERLGAEFLRSYQQVLL